MIHRLDPEGAPLITTSHPAWRRGVREKTLASVSTTIAVDHHGRDPEGGGGAQESA